MSSETAAPAKPSARLPTSALLRGLVFFVMMLSVLGGGHWYLGRRLIAAPQWPWPIEPLGWALLAFFFLAVPASFILPRLRGKPHWWLMATASVWIGAFGLLLTATFLADVLKFAAERLLNTSVEPQMWTRWWAAGALIVGLGAVVWGIRVARGAARIERVKIPVENLPPALEGVRVVQISDIHIGQMHAPKFLERVVETVNGLDADVVAVTGDLVDGFVQNLRDDVAPLGQLRAKHGVFFVTGNHEYYWGAEAWMAEVRRLGLTVLHNEHRVLHIRESPLVIAGVPDHEGGHFYPDHTPNPKRALQGAPENAPRILLAHQPRTAATIRGERVDLQLSGHTHAGQIFPFMFFVRLQQPVVRGLARLHGVLTYTSQGTGFWGPPMRVGTFSEITELTLVRA